MSDSIIDRLKAQRQMLVDIVRQVDIAIGVFAGSNGVATPNGNRQNWAARTSPERMAIIVAKRAKTRRRHERAARRAAFKKDAEQAAREREGQPSFA